MNTTLKILNEKIIKSNLAMCNNIYIYVSVSFVF